MKALLAATLAIATLAGSAVVVQTAEAAPVKVVIKPGYPYNHGGVRYKYNYGGRYYNQREYKCVMKYHRKVCKYRYW